MGRRLSHSLVRIVHPPYKADKLSIFSISVSRWGLTVGEGLERLGVGHTLVENQLVVFGFLHGFLVFDLHVTHDLVWVVD